MNTETQSGDWQKIKEIFSLALEKDAQERADFLTAACAGDTDLRTEVESWLDSYEEAEEFIESPIFSANEVFTKEDSAVIGKRFGNYKIIEEIGRGGMGTVFLAERVDGEFNQQVALKIVRQTIIDSETENRFRRERQILASLNHPNIAQLLDGGVSSAGEPFLVMEFVKGKPLVEFADSQNLTVKERLKLFLKICSAVSFAHRNLIVHRDLKPLNIIITGEGEPKLLDFGLAKILDLETDETHTATAFRAFTPSYASPEQLRGGSVSTASDIYSLGVVLYELLTGKRPFEYQGKSLEQIIKTVTESAPFLPSKVQNSNFNLQSLKGDIDNIISVALRNEPERRYKSVEAFAEDIERHLDGLPVFARPSTFVYRTSKFIRRNKIAAAATAVILLTVIGGIVATAQQSRIAQRERDKANIEKAKAESVSGFLTQMLNYSDPNTNLQREMTVKEILDRAAAQLDTGSFSSQPETNAELDTIIGYSYTAQGLNESAEKHFRRSLAKQTELFGEDSLEVLKTKTLLASAILSLGKNTESEQIYRKILPRLRTDYRNGAIAADYPADALHEYAVLRRAQGDSKEAEEILREGLTLLPFLSANGQNFTTANNRNLPTLIRNSLALTLFDQGKLDEAIAMARENIGELRRTTPANTPEFGYALTGFGNYLTEKGEYVEAQAVLSEAEAIYRNLLGNSHLFLGDNLRIQANMYYQQEKFESAQSKITETLKIYRANTSTQYINYPTALTIEALILNKTGKHSEAEKILLEAVKIRLENLPEGNFLTAHAKSALGECLTTQKRFDEAEPLLITSYESLKTSQGEQNPRTLIARNRLVELYTNWNKPEQAEKFRYSSTPN